MAFSLPSPCCERFELENNQLTEKSPVAARWGRQDKWFTFYASTGLSGCRVDGSTGVLQVQRPRGAFSTLGRKSPDSTPAGHNRRKRRHWRPPCQARPSDLMGCSAWWRGFPL